MRRELRYSVCQKLSGASQCPRCLVTLPLAPARPGQVEGVPAVAGQLLARRHLAGPGQGTPFCAKPNGAEPSQTNDQPYQRVSRRGPKQLNHHTSNPYRPELTRQRQDGLDTGGYWRHIDRRQRRELPAVANCACVHRGRRGWRENAGGG